MIDIFAHVNPESDNKLKVSTLIGTVVWSLEDNLHFDRTISYVSDEANPVVFWLVLVQLNRLLQNGGHIY